MIKIRMEDFGYKPADLAAAYGDKGTISKVLNYKQPLSLKMIRLFSKKLRIPADALIKNTNCNSLLSYRLTGVSSWRKCVMVWLTVTEGTGTIASLRKLMPRP
jgi:hypothetical protein